MRTLIIAIIIIGFAGCGKAQSSNQDFTDFYNKYQDDSGIISFSFPTFFAKMFIDNDDKEAKKVFDKLKNMRFFICEHDNGYYSKVIKKYLPDGTYNDLIVIREGKEKVSFKIKEPRNGKIKEIILTVEEPDSFVAICFTGNFTEEDAQEIASSINTGKIGSIRM